MIGMFIFGGKKKKSVEEIYEKLAREYGLTVDQVKKIEDILVNMTRNLPELAANADPEKDVKKIYKILDVNDLSAVRGGEKYIYISSIEDHKYHTQ